MSDIPITSSDGDAQARPEPAVEPYVPFPGFTEWLSEPFDPRIYDAFAGELEQDKEEASPATLSDAIAQATRWAAINTGAIEGLYEVDRGFTYTVAASAAAWADLHLATDESATRAMQDQLEAYDFVLDATTEAYPITEAWVRTLHETVTASQESYRVLTAVGWQDQELPKGAYKSQPNSPLNVGTNLVHSYAPPIDTPPEMARFVAELRSPGFNSAHPIVQAAYAHYAFVCIHPFADGNGRVSRALASVFLYRSPGIPLVIFADQKGEYIDSLEAADRGDPSRFVRFISERVIDTVGMIRAEMAAAQIPPVSAQMAKLLPVLTGKAGLSHVQIDAIAGRVLTMFREAVDQSISAAGIGDPLSFNISNMGLGSGTLGVPERQLDYRFQPGNQTVVQIAIGSAAPAAANQYRNYSVAIARPETDGADFLIFSETRVLLSIELREVNPTISSALTFRAQAAANREIRELVAEVSAQAADSLRRGGYIN